MCLTAHAFSPKSHIYWPSPTSLKQFLRAIWEAVSQAMVISESPDKTETYSSHVVRFYLSTISVTTKGPRTDFSPSPELCEDSEPWYHQGALGTIKGPLFPSTSSLRPGEFRWVSPGSQIAWILIDDPEFYLAVNNRYLGKAGWKTLGEIHPPPPVERYWAFLSWKILSSLDCVIR